MTTPDPVDELLGAMFTAWRRDIDSEPLRPFEAAVLAGERTSGEELSSF